MAKSWVSPFAASGDKIVIPQPLQAGGEVSVTEGWGSDYELPDTDPDYKPVGREEMNGLFNMVTESVGLIQKQGAADWDPDFGAYPKGAEVLHSGERWYNPVAGNTTEPGAGGTTWIPAGSVPDATTTIKGIIKIATTLESRTGVAGAAIDAEKLKEAFYVTGDAPMFACRAFVNFNASGTVAIRSSGNISSVTDNGVGDFTINFATAMPDANYAMVSTCKLANNNTRDSTYTAQPFNYLTGSVRVLTYNDLGNPTDPVFVNLAFFR